MQVTLRRRRCGRGFTLIEVLTSLFALCLILTGSVALFIATLRMTASVTNSTSVSLDAATAAQRVIENLREAQDFVPVDASRNPVPDGSSGSGLYICFPSAYKPVTVGRGGGATVTLSATPAAGPPSAVYDTSSFTKNLYIYRSDGSGNPSENGTCLWIQGTENGAAVPSSVVNGVAVPGHSLVKTLDPASPSAVQFSKVMDTNTPPNVLPFRVQISISCSTPDTLHARTSSDSTAGDTVSMTGECVQIRNHGSVPNAFVGPLPLP